jgi:hypothetical protein
MEVEVAGVKYRYRKPVLALLSKVLKFEKERGLNSLLESFAQTGEIGEAGNVWREYIALFIENADDNLRLEVLTLEEIRSITGGFTQAAGLVPPRPTA